jgi:biopolymer transport protein TolR
MVLSLNKQGLVFIRDQPVHPSQLVDRLRPLLEARGDDSVFLKGDKDLAYGKVIEVLDVLHQGGVTRVGLVTEGISVFDS